MNGSGDGPDVSRRAVLKASGGALGAAGVGTVGATEGDGGKPGCPEATVRPNMVHYDDSIHEVCSDDHPATEAIQTEVAASLESRYATVGDLIEEGYVPYFDFLTADDGWSHWINPEYVGDDSVLDPERPESILVDHQWWRPIGVMFIATRNGDPVDPPPTVYETDEDGTEECVPWHSHVGLPGRYSWWKYRLYYTDAPKSQLLQRPCRTPWMMHVWTTDSHPESLYAHGAPPRGDRGGPPAEPAGFETDAVPGEDELGPEVLPDAIAYAIERRKRGRKKDESRK